MRIKWMKAVLIQMVFVLVLFGNFSTVYAQENQEEKDESVQRLGDVVVKEKAGAAGVTVSPEKTEIDLDRYKSVGVSTSVSEMLKTNAIVDFRGDNNLTPGVDDIYLRGFDSKRFVTSIDSITLQKTGGRKSSNIVDYAILPTFIIKKIEILPGPHSALYDSKSIGGVINMKTLPPREYESAKPEITLDTSYRSYNTQVHNANVQGGIDRFIYDFGYQKNRTDGYLRHSESDIDNLFGRVGMILPEKGFVTLSSYYSDVDRDPAVNNTSEDGGDYDDDYPSGSGGLFDPYQDPTWDGFASGYRLNYEQSLAIGRLQLGGYYSEETRTRTYFADPGDSQRESLDTKWSQQGGKLQDEIKWAEQHTTTVGLDFVQMFDEGHGSARHERINKKAGYLQHQWDITKSLDLKLGARYEAVKIWVSNSSSGELYIPGRGEWIERDWDQWVPKSFATWKMDGMADWLRDTSVSAGVSKIWRAPDYHGDYNPQGRPAGAWLDPEHGVGYDLVLNRRLWGNIDFKINYAFYDIKDYIASNRDYAQSSDYSDYKINLEEVYRHGVDLNLSGNITEPLSFYLSYAWQTFENQGDEPAGETELDQLAENRVNAGLRYALFDKTDLMLDYYYQSEEVTEVYDDATEYFSEVKNDPYHLIDIGVTQTLLESKGIVKDLELSLYIKNLFNEKYYENAGSSAGFPATDRTYGISLSLKV